MNHSANSKCHVYFIKYSFGFPEWNELPLADKLATRNVCPVQNRSPFTLWEN